MEQSMKGEKKKKKDFEFCFFFLWWEISSPVDGSSQSCKSCMHVSCAPQDGKTLHQIIGCEEVDVKNIFMRGLLRFFCCVACKRNYIFCIFSSQGKYIHIQTLLPNLSNLYSFKKKKLKPKLSACEMPSSLTLKFLQPQTRKLPFK